MAKVALTNIQGAAVGEIELSDNTFGVQVNESAMHLVVRAQLNAQRQGTQSAKTRTEVRRSQDLSPEGHRQCASSFQSRTSVQARRRGIRAQAPRLFHLRSAQGTPPGDEERADQQGAGRLDHRAGQPDPG